MQLVPSEISLWGVYFAPLFFATLLGMILAVGTAFALNRYRLSRYFYYPPVVFLALTVIYTGLIGKFVIPV